MFDLNTVTPDGLRARAQMLRECEPLMRNDSGSAANHMDAAANKIERLEALGAEAIGSLKACLANPQLSDAQQQLARGTLDAFFNEQERWSTPAPKR